MKEKGPKAREGNYSRLSSHLSYLKKIPTFGGFFLPNH